MKKIILLLLSISSLYGIDLPTFWKAELFQGEPGDDVRDYAHFMDVKASYGKATSGYNKGGNTANILNIHGLVDINNLAINLENLSNNSLKPKTYEFLRETNGTIPALTFTGDNGKIELNGKVETSEVALEIRQNIRSGFYGKVHIPLRKVKVNEITLINKTDSEVIGASTFQSFLDDDLDTVLSENGLDPLTTPYNNEDIGDIAIHAGWQGFLDNIDVIKSLTGEVAASVTIPSAPHSKNHRVVSVPLGYDGHWGFGVRGSTQAYITDWIAVGASGGANVFLSRTTEQRMQTSTDQNGLIVLERGNAEVVPGSIFDLGGYIKVGQPQGLAYIIGGYAFASQESKRLVVKDDNFLSTLLLSEQQAGTITSNKDTIVNGDSRLEQWDHHTIQLLMGIDLRAITDVPIAPRIEGFYNIPVFGKRVWRTDLVGGGGGMRFQWDF